MAYARWTRYWPLAAEIGLREDLKKSEAKKTASSENKQSSQAGQRDSTNRPGMSV